MPWHPISERPELGKNVVLRGRKGALYVGSRREWVNGGSYYYIQNNRNNFLNEYQAVAWCDIDPYERPQDEQ